MGKVLFACSIEKNLKKKIKADVKAAAEFGEKLDRMYFFYNLPIKIGDRNKFRDAALKDHDIRLEIIDGKAIAEFLADPELLWIAELYLRLPSEIGLPSPDKPPSWYAVLLNTPESGLPTNSDTFYQLKSAIRYASKAPERHSEIPRFIERLRRFRSHPNNTIARRAFYEEFVAMLRGLNAAEGYEDQIVEYLSSIEQIDDAPGLEDASIILSYANAACLRGILKIPVSVRRQFRDKLLAKLDSLIAPEASFFTCSLLYIKGYVLLNSPVLDDDPKTEPEAAIAQGAAKAIEVWEILLKHAREISLFPIERLRPLANFIFPLFESKEFAAFVRRVDEITTERAGVSSLAEQHEERASALLDAEDFLRSLHEFHEALRLSHNLKSQGRAIRVCLQLSSLYHHVGLHHASKYYGLAASYAALRFPEDELKRMAAVGLAHAAEADYTSGASLLFFLTAEAFMKVAEEFAVAGKKSFREKQWQKVDYYALLLTRAAEIVGKDCHTRCMKLLRRLGGEETYVEMQSQLDRMFEGLDRVGLLKRYTQEGIAAPFADFAARRATSWMQMGMTWRVEWDSTYESERHGEAFCAVLQIILAALAGIELSLIASTATIEISTNHDGDEEVQQVPDNNILRFSLAIDPNRGMSLMAYITTIYYVLAASSAIPEDRFKVHFSDQFNRGLPQKVGVYIAPADAFAQFYLREEYQSLHGGDPIGQPEISPSQTSEGISEVVAIHPQFDEPEALQLIKNRYKNTVKMIPHTLARLLKDESFLNLVSKLRGEGWKDWHILLAITNVRMNSLVDVRKSNYKELFKAKSESGESSDDAPAPAQAFEEENLKRALEISQVSTLTGIGFRMDQMTPNTPGIDAFLRRFRYWDLDVPHTDPFAFTPIPAA